MSAVTPLGRSFVERLWAQQEKGAQMRAASVGGLQQHALDPDDDPDLPRDSVAGSEARPRSPEVSPIPPRADRVAVALMLGRALQPVRHIARSLETAAPMLLLRATDPGPIAERIAALVSAGALAPGRDGLISVADVLMGAVRHSDANRRMIVLSDREIETGATRGGPARPSKSPPDLVLASVLALGVPVIIVTNQETENALAAAARPFVEREVVLPTIDPALVSATLRLVYRTRRVRRLDDETASALTLSDLALAVRPGIGTAQAIGSLERLAAARRETSTEIPIEGPRLEEMSGYGPAREWGLELARDLADWRDGRIQWSAVDRGLLLSGPPGTGKTSFARALAKTCGVPLIASSVAQWQQNDGHLGKVLGKMKATFDEALSKAPSILFLDELDGIGRRDTLSGDYIEYWEQVINSLLELVDGSSSREGVVIVGATNHPDRIDPALRRAGRLDRHIRIPIPDIPALERILRVHLGSDLQGHDLRPIARRCVGDTGADVASHVRRARRIARRASRALTVEDLLTAITQDRPRRSDRIRWVTAVHEAGHAVAAIRLGRARAVTIAIDQAHGGTTNSDVDGLAGLPTREDALAHIAVGLSGRAAEHVIIGVPSTGAGGPEASDLAAASALALALETSFGLGETEDLLWHAPGVALSRLAADEALRARVSAVLDAAYDRARALVVAERDAVLRLARALMDRSVLDAEEVAQLMATAPEPGKDMEESDSAPIEDAPRRHGGPPSADA